MHSAMRLSMRIVALRVSPAAAEWLGSSAAAKPRPDNALCFPRKSTHARSRPPRGSAGRPLTLYAAQLARVAAARALAIAVARQHCQVPPPWLQLRGVHPTNTPQY